MATHPVRTMTSMLRSPKTWYWGAVAAMVIAAMAIAATVAGGPAILSAQTAEPSVAQGADATATTTEVEIQRRFNELRRELLDDRADTINWWLAATAIFLTLFGIVAPIAGYIGFKRIEAEARQSVEQAREYVEEIRKHREQSEEDTQRIRASLQQAVEDIQDYQNIDKPEEVEGAVQEDQDSPASTLADRAIARAESLQEEGRTQEAIEKWRAIAHVAEGIDNELAADAWFSVGYLLQEGRHGESSGN